MLTEWIQSLPPRSKLCGRRGSNAADCRPHVLCCTVGDRFFLEDHSTPPNIKDDRGDTPLNVAAYAGQPAAVEELLRQGANINAKNNKVAAMSWSCMCLYVCVRTAETRDPAVPLTGVICLMRPITFQTVATGKFSVVADSSKTSWVNSAGPTSQYMIRRSHSTKYMESNENTHAQNVAENTWCRGGRYWLGTNAMTHIVGQASNI